VALTLNTGEHSKSCFFVGRFGFTKKYSINYAVNFVVVSLGESLSSLLVSTGYR